MSISKNVIYYGREEPLPEKIALRAGPLSLIYENGDLRYIKMGEREILRRVYVAVRDRNWGTVPGQLSNLKMDVWEDSFGISYEMEHKQGDVNFFWVGSITGAADGTITFRMMGKARSTFARNRIGFCVLHPMQLAGHACTVTHVDGSATDGTFPQYIAPHQPFKNIRAITHEILPGVAGEVLMEGDIFEMEDQRNWTDASYKTYCTPLALPFPVEIEDGTEIVQTVTLRLHGDLLQVVPVKKDRLSFSLKPSRITPLPRVGLGTASHGRPLSEEEIDYIQRLNLAHLRVDLQLNTPNVRETLLRAAREAGMLDIELEIALHLSDSAEQELKDFRALLDEVMPPVCTWLIFHLDEMSTSKKWVQLARAYLTDYDVNARFGAGTDAFFAELNRDRPPVSVLNLVTYSINPQVHAFDNASLVETLEAQGVTLESARQFSGDAGLVVSPVTLKMRFNPNATGPEPEPKPGELPPRVDLRQMSLFGAGWTIGSIKYLAEGGAYSVTFYETTGWRGVMESEAGPSRPNRFPSMPGKVFPLYYVFADLSTFAGGEIIKSVSSDPLVIDGLVVRKGRGVRVLLANFTSKTQVVKIEGLKGAAALKPLDESNFEEALSDVEGFQLQTIKMYRSGAEDLEVTLKPFAMIRIDSEMA